jgi:hypothetical protein
MHYKQISIKNKRYFCESYSFYMISEYTTSRHTSVVPQNTSPPPTSLVIPTTHLHAIFRKLMVSVIGKTEKSFWQL